MPVDRQLTRILVPLDGSSHCELAIQLGIRWAKQYHAKLMGMGIVDEPAIRHSEPIPLGAESFKIKRDEALMADARCRVSEFLERFTQRCAEAGVASDTLTDVGHPFEQIVIEAQRCDLILLGKQTHYHFETDDKADDTLQKVLKVSPRPLVTVPERPQGGSAIVIAYDGSLQSARTLYAFQSLHLDMSSEIHIISVGEDRVKARRSAEIAADFLESHGVKSQSHIVETSDLPAPVILERTRALNAGLLVMGAYGQSTVKEFFFGSVTRAMLSDENIPLFLYH